MKTKNPIYNFICFIVTFCGGILLAFLSLICIFNQVFITMNGNETVIFHKNGPGIIVLLILQLLLLVGAGLLIKRISSGMLFAIMAVGYIIAGIYLIFQVDGSLRADAYNVYQAAINYNQGNFVDFEPGQYMFRFPFQLALMTYDRLLAYISTDIRLFYMMNLLWVLGANYFLWKIATVLFKEKPLIHGYTILLSFMFLPQFFFVLFVYGQVPGLVCMVAAVYFMLKQLRGYSGYNWLFSILFAVLANFLKSNFKIAIIAMLIVYFCYFCVQKKKQYLLIMVGMLAAVFLSGALLEKYYELDMNREIGKGTPMIMWVAMGLQDDENSTTQGGWINGYNIYRFNDVGYDYDAATRRALTSIHRSAIRFWEDPAYCVQFFWEKIVSTWCDPMYQSVWSGPLVAKEDSDGKLLDEIYSGGQIYNHLANWCNGVVILILGLALAAVVGIVCYIEKTERILYFFPVIYLIGGFLFHVFWETKSQYVYMYVLCLVPLSAYGLNLLYEKIRVYISAKRKGTESGTAYNEAEM